jgi:hypothetical protein
MDIFSCLKISGYITVESWGFGILDCWITGLLEVMRRLTQTIQHCKNPLIQQSDDLFIKKAA